MSEPKPKKIRRTISTNSLVVLVNIIGEAFDSVRAVSSEKEGVLLELESARRDIEAQAKRIDELEGDEKAPGRVQAERDAVREINEGLLTHTKELEKKLLDSLERLHLPERADAGPVADRVILALNRLSECFSGCNEQLAKAYEERDELKDYALKLSDATKAGLVLQRERDEARAQALKSTEDVKRLVDALRRIGTHGFEDTGAKELAKIARDALGGEMAWPAR